MRGENVKGFVWFKMPVAWADSLAAMTDEQAGIMIKAVYKYIVQGIEPVFEDKILASFWVNVERWIARDAANYKQLKGNALTRR